MLHQHFDFRNCENVHRKSITNTNTMLLYLLLHLSQAFLQICCLQCWWFNCWLLFLRSTFLMVLWFIKKNRITCFFFWSLFRADWQGLHELLERTQRVIRAVYNGHTWKSGSSELITLGKEWRTLDYGSRFQCGSTATDLTSIPASKPLKVFETLDILQKPSLQCPHVRLIACSRLKQSSCQVRAS